MKLSINEGEPGYQQWVDVRIAGKTPRIFLDGVETSQVIAVDEEGGWVRRYAVDEITNRFRLNDDGDELLAETVTGKVRIVLDDT
jgi:hypothetical protein